MSVVEQGEGIARATGSSEVLHAADGHGCADGPSGVVPKPRAIICQVSDGNGYCVRKG
jgi:hypothetical protein